MQAEKYELLAKALQADGQDVGSDEFATLEAVFAAANLVLERSMASE